MLATLRGILGRPTPKSSEVERQAAILLDGMGELRPCVGDNLLQTFQDKVTSEKLTGSLERLTRVADICPAVQHYMQDKGISGEVTISDDDLLQTLDWSCIERTDEIVAHRGLAVGVARLAVAETGSIVMASSPQTPTLHNFLPLHHLVVLPASRVRAYLDDIWLEIDPRDHRSVNIITGTSGTADIEGRNVRGAHGPRFLHVLLIEGN